jgi:hypothetical protein
MKLKIKSEFLDEIIFCPFTKQNVFVRFIDSEMYGLYSKKGYSNLFEEDKPKKVVKKEEPTNDISESRD